MEEKNNNERDFMADTIKRSTFTERQKDKAQTS